MHQEWTSDMQFHALLWWKKKQVRQAAVAVISVNVQCNPLPPGTEVPPQASLVFSVLLVDLFNPKDDITIDNQEVPVPCTRKSVTGDFIRYHYNGTFQDGTPFDSR